MQNHSSPKGVSAHMEDQETSSNLSNGTSTHSRSSNSSGSEKFEAHTEPLNLHRGNRQHGPIGKLKNYICNMIRSSPFISLSLSYFTFSFGSLRFFPVSINSLCFL